MMLKFLENTVDSQEIHKWIIMDEIIVLALWEKAPLLGKVEEKSEEKDNQQQDEGTVLKW